MTLTFVVADQTDERLLRLKGQEVLAIDPGMVGGAGLQTMISILIISLNREDLRTTRHRKSLLRKCQKPVVSLLGCKLRLHCRCTDLLLFKHYFVV